MKNNENEQLKCSDLKDVRIIIDSKNVDKVHHIFSKGNNLNISKEKHSEVTLTKKMGIGCKSVHISDVINGLWVYSDSRGNRFVFPLIKVMRVYELVGFKRYNDTTTKKNSPILFTCLET